MANIKLGAIITDIAGSVGGSTFRRTPAGVILYNKQGTQIKSAFAQKGVKNKLGAIISGWTTLDPADKTTWENYATMYPFPDKFGNLKYLTGRQLYIKLNGQLIPTDKRVDLSTFVDSVPVEIVTDVYIDRGKNKFIISWDIVSDSKYCLVQVTPLRAGSSSKPRKKAYCTYHKDVTGVDTINIWSYFEPQYPNFVPKSWWNVNIIFMNYSGFQNSVQSFKVQL